MRRTTLLFIALIASGSTLTTRAQETQRVTTEPGAGCVAVLGAVNQPARFQLKRRIRLLEAVTFSGGVTANAGPTIQITSTGAKCPMEAKSAVDATAPAPR